MKKFVFPIILGFLLFWPLRLESKRLFVKMTFGFFYGGDLTDSWHLNPDYYDYTLFQVEKTGQGMDMSLEFIYQIHPNIGFALGTGYVSRTINGSSGLFILLGENEPVEDFTLIPKFSTDMTPFYLTAIVTLPIKRPFQLKFMGGMSYYLGNITGTKIVEIHAEDINPSMIANRLLWKYESRVKALGFHGGAGIDIALSKKTFFFIEALYRFAEFKKFKTSLQDITNEVFASLGPGRGEDLGEDSTFFYVQKIREVEEQKNIDYRISDLNFSGLSIRIGIKFGF